MKYKHYGLWNMKNIFIITIMYWNVKKKVYLKNIFHMHTNTPIKYKYKYFILWVFKYK